jgi:hypothetical protein
VRGRATKTKTSGGLKLRLSLNMFIEFVIKILLNTVFANVKIGYEVTYDLKPKFAAGCILTQADGFFCRGQKHF